MRRYLVRREISQTDSTEALGRLGVYRSFRDY